ncbi:hypothetical protein N9903_01635, partial [bacterium]|nr:hypothetical protein [bacterium]
AGLFLPRNFNMNTHFFYGHSVLWGLIGTITAVGILASEWPAAKRCDRRYWLLAITATTVLFFNIFAGMVLCSAFTLTALFFGWKSWKTWLGCAALGVTSSIIIVLMGIPGAPTKSFVMADVVSSVPKLAWQMLGFGLLLYGFKILDFRRLTLFPFMIFAFSATCILFPALFVDEVLSRDKNQQYPLFFLSHILGVLSMVFFSGIVSLWAQGERKKVFVEAVFALRLILGTAVGATLVWCLQVIFRALSGPAPGTHAILMPAASIAYSLFILALLKSLQSRRLRILAGGGIVLMFMLGLLSTMKTVLAYTLGNSRNSIILSAGEYRGLKRLKSVSVAGDRVATNKHEIEERGPAKSYQYMTLSERKVLLEGWGYREYHLPGFAELRLDNEGIFSTDDLSELHALLVKHDIDFIVCRPETNLQIASIVPWLQEIEDAGSLKIYRVEL